MAKRNLVTCVYQSDDGKSMLRRLDSRYQSQMNGADPAAPILGGVAANATQRRTMSFGPSGLKPRSVLVATADGAFTGRLPVFTLAAYSAIAVGDAITFYDGQGASHSGTVEGKEGERSRHAHDVA